MNGSFASIAARAWQRARANTTYQEYLLAFSDIIGVSPAIASSRLRRRILGQIDAVVDPVTSCLPLFHGSGLDEQFTAQPPITRISEASRERHECLMKW